MEISDVRVKLIMVPEDRLKAVCSVTFDEVFVVRDIKVVDGSNGLFVAMPSRKLSSHCPRCKQKNHLKARFCNECGGQLPPHRGPDDPSNRNRMHRDLAHPVNLDFREELQRRVIAAFEQELERSRDPNYLPREIDADQEEPVAAVDTPVETRRSSGRERSEYDEMIAGLKAGTLGPREPSRPAPRGRETSGPPPRGPGQPQRDDGARRPPRDRGGNGATRDGGPRRAAQGPPPRGEPARDARRGREDHREQRGERKPAPRPAEGPHSEATDGEAEVFGASISAPPPPPARKPSPPPPAPERPAPTKPVKPAPVVEEDDTGFGAGLF